MNFYEVSDEQFRKDCAKCGVIPDGYKAKLPIRATRRSAGYDIFSPLDFTVNPNEVITIPTGIGIEMPEDKFLLICPRSGIGFKTGVRLANTIGVIDSDYSYATNGGHIMIKFVGGFEPLTINKGDRIAQGVILKYYTCDDDIVLSEDRQGGFGSSGK